MANGFCNATMHEWSNLGQGAPEVGPIPNAPPRPETIPVPTDSLEYAPTTGVKGNCHTDKFSESIYHSFRTPRGCCESLQSYIPAGKSQPIYIRKHLHRPWWTCWALEGCRCCRRCLLCEFKPSAQVVMTSDLSLAEPPDTGLHGLRSSSERLQASYTYAYNVSRKSTVCVWLLRENVSLDETVGQCYILRGSECTNVTEAQVPLGYR